MLAHLVFVSRYILFFAGAMFIASALHHGSAHDGLKALVFFAAMLGGHWWLLRENKLADCERALDGLLGGEEGGPDALLDRSEALARRRGTPGFDPWEVQALRREIRDYVKTHPGSNARFDGCW